MNRFLGCLLLASLVLPVHTAYAEIVNLPAEEAYEKAMDYVLDLGAIPTMENEKRLIFKTDMLTTKLDRKECDCGRMFGIPYMKDKRTTTDVSYQIRVKKLDEERSDVTVKVSIDGYYIQKKGKLTAIVSRHRDRDKILECTSRGVLETRLIDYINEE